MRYVVAGGTGAIGRVLMPLLVQRVGLDNILCIVRSTSDTRQLRELGVELRVCDPNDPDSCLVTIEPKSTYIGIVTGNTPLFADTLESLQRAGIWRAIFLSSTQQDEGLRENEERIRQSGILYTILRPSLIYGSTPDINSIQQIVRIIARWPVVPLPGKGDNLLQPVFIEDVSRALLATLDNPQAENKEYVLAGPLPIPFREIIHTSADILGKQVALVPIPLKAALPMVYCLERIPRFPLTAHKLAALRENRSFDISPAVGDLGYKPRPFADGVWLEIRKMREHGMIR